MAGAIAGSAPDEQALEDLLDKNQREADEEILELQAKVGRPSLSCRWNFHAYITVDPTDEEHEELCKLLGRSRSNLSVSGVRELLDRVCHKCGHIDPGLQRFLISLRKLRQTVKRK